MSSAVNSLQKALVSGEWSLAGLLHQTQLIAAKLNLRDVERWVGLELKGYPKSAELPDYRKILSDGLEIYNADRESWQFAGRLNCALAVRQPISEVENISPEDRIGFPVPKSFSIKNYLGDSFGSDWPQRFVVRGSRFKGIMEAAANRWKAELETRGIKVVDLQKFMAALSAAADS